ncbi:MAG: helicase-associated domain-containing protein [Anaerolineae bacterium]|jgi:hypothetical protein
MRTLRQCLLDADLVRLRVIARFWGVELTAGRRLDVAAQLAEAMVVPETVAAAWNALPEDQRQALDALLAAGGPMPLQVFAREWGEIRAMGPGRMERERPWRDPVSPLEGLWYRGFISRAFEQGTEGTYEAVFVPSELREYLVTASASADALTFSPIPEPASVCSAGDALLDDACTMLAYLQNERLQLHPDGSWPVRSESLVSRRLRDPNPTRLVFLRHLVRGLGWLRVTDSAYLRPDPGPATVWLRSAPDQQRRVLAEAWRDDPTWNDLFHIPGLVPEDTGAWRNDPLSARKSILLYLKACLPGAWYAFDGFVGAIKRVDPDFQRPDGDYTTWYIKDAATGAYLSGFESWDAVEGALIRFLITGPLAWLGLVDLGVVIPGAIPAAFRLTPAGARFLGLADPQSEPEPVPLTLHRDFSVLVPAARRYERFQLARVADWVSSLGLESEFFTYRLMPTSLERARQQGISVARVLEFLSQATGAPVPRSVEVALTRWDARGPEARLERVSILRLASEELMAQAMSFPSTRRLIREQIGPKAALVREKDWSRLVAALGEMGVVPDIIYLEGTLPE